MKNVTLVDSWNLSAANSARRHPRGDWSKAPAHIVATNGDGQYWAYSFVGDMRAAAFEIACAIAQGANMDGRYVAFDPLARAVLVKDADKGDAMVERDAGEWVINTEVYPDAITA